MLIVLDTNVLVSSLLKRNSNPAIILNAVLEGKIRLAIDERIFEEYTQVLHRPRLNILPAQADSTLRFIAFSALWVQSQPVEFQQDLINDPGDLPFAEIAICSHAEVLITGNMKHFAFMSNSGIKVLLPQEFLADYKHIT
jgi:putative PIN family toxin of toxin-antitoxin system